MIPINHPFVNQPQALKKPFPTCAETPAALDSASASVSPLGTAPQTVEKLVYNSADFG